MRFFVSLLLLAVPSIVSACEGDCIVGVTNAFVGNYTILIDLVFRSLVRFILLFCGSSMVTPSVHARRSPRPSKSQTSFLATPP